MKQLLDKRRIDVTKTFLVFVATVGDVEKTALACDLDPQVVRELALNEGWTEKVKRLCIASKGNGLRSGDFERMQNRALNWVQSHRLRQVIDTVLCRFADMTEAELQEALETTDKNGSKRVSARFFTDIAKALETVHHMSYQALGDSIPERQVMTADEKDNTAATHAALIAALNGPGARALPSETLLAEVVKSIDRAPLKALPPVSPEQQPPVP